MAKKHSIVVGLDIGTSKVCAIVGEMTEHGVEVIGVGTHSSQGLRKGVVINIESTVNSIKKAVEEAELMAGCEIHTIFTGIAGGHIKGFNSHGIVAVKNKEVTPRDLDRVIDAAKAVAIPMDREVLHVLPQDYIIDDQDGIKEPLGMSGVRLEAKVHIVTGAVTSAQNIIKCCNRTGLNVADIVLEPLASAEAVLSDQERELDVAGVDMTGGSMLLSGAIEMAEQIFGIPVRLGIPRHVGGLVDVISSPVYATGVGLVLYGMKRQERNFFRIRDDRIFSKVKHRMADW